MNGILFVTGIIFLIMGFAFLTHAPNLVYGFYDFTGLNNLKIYQKQEVISQVIDGTQLNGLLLVIAGTIFIPLSKYYYP